MTLSGVWKVTGECKRKATWRKPRSSPQQQPDNTTRYGCKQRRFAGGDRDDHEQQALAPGRLDTPP